MFLSSNPEFRFNRVLCAGVSLGGHSTYHVLSDGKCALDAAASLSAELMR